MSDDDFGTQEKEALLISEAIPLKRLTWVLCLIIKQWPYLHEKWLKKVWNLTKEKRIESSFKTISINLRQLRGEHKGICNR